MFIWAGLMIVLGLSAAVFSWSAKYRRYSVRRLAKDIGDTASDGNQAVLEARVGRQTLAMGLGVVAAGAVLLVAALFWQPDVDALGGPFHLLALPLAFSAVALAAVEIWWPSAGRGSGIRTARTSVPVLQDYLPRYVVVLTWSLGFLSWLTLAGVLLLGETKWFDERVILDGPVPVLGLALTILSVLTVFAVRQVLNAPQPARDERELYWQDAMRASTLFTLHSALAMVAILALVVVAETLDAAASAVSLASGQVGPAWTGIVLVLAYILLPVMVLVSVGIVISAVSDGQRGHFRRRLWTGDGGHRKASA